MERRLLAWLVALMALAMLPATPAVAAPQAPDRPLKVMTYNIHHGAGVDGVVDLERIAQVIENSGADVVALQEVDRHFAARSSYVDQATWLSERLGMRMVFGTNLDLDPLNPGEPRRQYGTAILSRYPILSWSNTLLPKREVSEQRGLLRAEVMVRGVPVTVLDTHLQHNSRVERLMQIEAINQTLATIGKSVVLMGDLNARPDTPEYAAFTQQLNDVWSLVGEGPGYTFDSDNPVGRIDYILIGGGTKAVSAEVINSLAADHMPVVTDLLLPGSAVGRS